MNITVYLGSASGNHPKYAREVIKLGTWIGKSGHRLIYGGSRIGGITQLIVTETMAERKEKLIAYGEAYIAFPGGTGTLEEISEVMSQVRLGHNDKPCIVFNLDGYYEPLRQMLDVMVREGFLDEESRSSFLFLPDVESIARALE